MHAATAACIACATDDADPHAATWPDRIWPAPANAARSAAACARCRAVTAEPTSTPAPVSTISSVIIAAAITLAEPCSDARFDRSDGLADDRDPRQQSRSRADPRHHEAAVTAQLQHRPARPRPVRRLRRRSRITPGRQSRCLARGVHAPHLHADRGESADAQHQDHRERRDGERRLHRDGTRVTRQTFVFNARVMMLVSALTIESPVTTV